jgi:long-chain acyl-CoA synthetase
MDDKVQVSREKNCEEVKGEGKPRVDIQVPANDELVSVPAWGDGKITTLWDSFVYSKNTFSDNPMLGTRPIIVGDDGKKARGDYIWETYAQVYDNALRIGAGLASLDQKKGDAIGIFSDNRSEWVQTQLGIFSRGMKVVSLYATLGESAVEFISKHAELQTVFVSKKNLKTYLAILDKVKAGAASTEESKEVGHLRQIVQFNENKDYGNSEETVSPEDVALCEEHDVKLISFSALLEAGSSTTGGEPTAVGEDEKPTAADDAFIMYTSGTTGTPKGALLSHGNLVATLSVCNSRFTLGPTDRHMSYLPLAHIFETVVEQAVFAQGGRVGFFQGDIKKLTLDQLTLRPTIWCGVPRVFDKVYKTIMAGVESGACISSVIFNRALTVTTEAVRKSADKKDRDAWYDENVFKKVCRDKLGLDQVRYIITGAAPCPAYLMEFLRILINCPVIQGYGMTETSAAAAIMQTTDITTGHNGAPLPCNEIKLVDVPDMEYFHTDTPCPRGEVWIRGPNIFQGYYKNPTATASDLTEDGWLKTGDVGRWNPNGTLSIIDRKKNMFKLSQGEYIAAENVESVYSKSSIVSQFFVYGNSYKNCVLGVVVPSPSELFAYFKSQNWWPRVQGEDLDAKTYLLSPEFLQHYHTVAEEHKDEVKTFVWNKLKASEGGLKGFEKVRQIIVETNIDKDGQGFTVENECITPTFKLRRPFLLRKYVTQLREAYTLAGEPPQEDEHWPGL